MLATQMALQLTDANVPGIQSAADLVNDGMLGGPMPSLPGGVVDRVLL